MSQEITTIVPGCTKRMSIGKGGEASPASIRPDAITEAVGGAINIISGLRSTAARHSS